MENFDFNALSVNEMGTNSLIEINGGQVIPAPSPWWSLASYIIELGCKAMTAAAEAYIEFSMETGGEYVIHHAK